MGRRSAFCLLTSAFRVTALLAIAPALAAQPFQLHGFLTARETRVEAQRSWLAGGAGRFDAGASSPDDRRNVALATAQVGADWTPLRWLTIHADGVARTRPAGARGDGAGIVQAYAQAAGERWRIRAGEFWLPTSRENTEALWTSKYTLTYSALNSWIAQEMRPLGVDLQWMPNFYVSAGVTAFRGNDTMGTLLAARGWTFGSYLATYGEDLPVPIAPIGGPVTTRPIGSELDHRNGYAERLRLSLPERAMVQVTHVDNRATLSDVPVRNEVPWLTRFNIVSAEAGSSSATTVAAEWARGTTAVGVSAPFTLDFDTAYLLVSHRFGRDRLTVRGERFATSPFGDEHGRAWTAAWLRDISSAVRGGLEYVRVKGDRPSFPPAFDSRTGGTTLTAEVRYAF